MDRVPILTCVPCRPLHTSTLRISLTDRRDLIRCLHPDGARRQDDERRPEMDACRNCRMGRRATPRWRIRLIGRAFAFADPTSDWRSSVARSTTWTLRTLSANHPLAGTPLDVRRFDHPYSEFLDRVEKP